MPDGKISERTIAGKMLFLQLAFADTIVNYAGKRF
jgi:hypothetical protein